VADHLLFETLGHFFQGSELLLFVFSLENQAVVKWKFDAPLGSRTLGMSVAQVQSPETWSASFAVIPRRMRKRAQLACTQAFCDNTNTRMTTNTIRTIFSDFLMDMSAHFPGPRS
jgi:hypothetical protein